MPEGDRYMLVVHFELSNGRMESFICEAEKSEDLLPGFIWRDAIRWEVYKGEDEERTEIRADRVVWRDLKFIKAPTNDDITVEKLDADSADPVERLTGRER